jgi:purine-nucleoside phosphorylase
MEKFMSMVEIDAAVAAIKSKTHHKPEIGLILGTGLGDLANAVQNADVIPYKDIPNWPLSTVQGHSGQLVIGSLHGREVMVLQGRSHYYEGYSMSEVTLPVRVMQRMGMKTLIVTNAAGAINPDYAPGDVMIISDHIAMIGMAGANPLRGPNLAEFGERFPDMSQAYDRDLVVQAEKVAAENHLVVRKGIYVCLGGPSFETPADLRFMRVIGTDAVGMSTVPEVIVARHGRMRVLGLSGISNKANLDGSTETTHEEVLEAGKVIVPKLMTIITGVLKQL